MNHCIEHIRFNHQKNQDLKIRQTLLQLLNVANNEIMVPLKHQVYGVKIQVLDFSPYIYWHWNS